MPCKRVATFSMEDVRALLATVDRSCRGRAARHTVQLGLYVRLALRCGLRLGEISGLTLASLDLERRVLHITGSMTSFKTLKGPKTKAGRRDVPIPADIHGMLVMWMEKHRIAHPLDLVFTTATGEAIRGPLFNISWRRVLDAAGLGGRGLRFHSLRHFAASHMVDHGLPVTDVAKLLGHESFDITLQVYAHPLGGIDKHRAALDAMALTASPMLALPAPSSPTRAA